MAAPKAPIPKDWWKATSPEPKIGNKALTFEQMRVKKLESLPAVLTAEDIAHYLKCHPKTVADWFAKGIVPSFKIQGRRYCREDVFLDWLAKQEAKNG